MELETCGCSHSETMAEGGEVKVKKVIRRNLPINKEYKLIDSFYTGGLTENPMTCENCGRPIANVAVLQDEDNKTYDVGMDCAETLSSIKNSSEFMVVGNNFKEATAIRNKIKKSIKDGGSIEAENVYWGAVYVNAKKDGRFLSNIGIPKSFFNKYLPDFKKYIVNTEKNNFSPRYSNSFDFAFDFGHFKPKEATPKEFIIDEYIANVRRIDKPNYFEDGVTVRNINNIIEIVVSKLGEPVGVDTTYTARDVPSNIISIINKFEFENYSDETFEEGGELKTIQYGDYVTFVNDSTQTNHQNTPLYKKGDGAHVINIINKEGKTFYTVKKSLFEIQNVPATDVVLYKKGVREKVEEILTIRQENKSFKDVGKRVSGSQKEKITMGNIINLSDLKALEADEITAMKTVVKERVYPEIDVEEQKALGVNSGAVFIKVEARKSCSATPPNDKNKRASYVKFINKFSGDTHNAKTVNEIKIIYDSYLKWTPNEIIGYFIDPSFLELPEEKRALLEKWFGEKFRHGSSSVVKTLITEIFGKRFSNFMFRGSDSAHATWVEGLNLEPISKELSDLLIEADKEQKLRFIKSNQAKVDYFKEATVDVLKSEMFNFSFGDIWKKHFKEDIENFRKWALEYYTKRVEGGEKKLTEINPATQQRENNWSWYEVSPEKRVIEKSKEIQINNNKPLAFIKRIGGVKISEQYVEKAKETDLEKNPITNDFGFKTVVFGQSLADRSAKEHIRHFLGAMSDLSEILGIDMKKLNKIGGLSISFASRGKGRAMATYEAGRNIINLTNKRGDGSISHEYFHYIDNALTAIGKEGISLLYGTDDSANILNKNVAERMKAIMNFIYKGADGITIPIKVLFKKDSRTNSYVPKFYTPKLGQKEVTILGTIEETIELLRTEYKDILSVDSKYPEFQKTILSYIISKFDLNEYEVSLSMKTSNFFHGSSLMSSAYWVKSHELFARASETYIWDKLVNAGRFNNYLVNDEMFGLTMLNSGNKTYLVPQGAERAYINTLFDDLIETMKKEYDLSGFTPVSNERENEYLVLEENQTTDENVEAGVIVNAKTEKVEEVIHNNVEVVIEPEVPVDFTEKDYQDALDGAMVMIEFAEGEEKQELLDYAESLRTMISLLE